MTPKVPALALAALAALATASCGGSAAPHGAAATTSAPAATTAPPDSTSRILAWVRGQGGRDFEKIGGQLKLSSRALGSGDPAAAARASARLAAFIRRVQQDDPPVPDATAERYYSLALTDWETAAVNCQAGATAPDASLLRNCVKDTNAGSAAFAKAGSRILALIRAAG